ncbi:hypothetical protein Tco_0573095 [Tanacetum coccineum]
MMGNLVLFVLSILLMNEFILWFWINNSRLDLCGKLNFDDGPSNVKFGWTEFLHQMALVWTWFVLVMQSTACSRHASTALKKLKNPEVIMESRHSVSSTSAHHNYGSSSSHGDDDEDDGASRASTPSPITYLNSLEPLNYQ